MDKNDLENSFFLNLINKLDLMSRDLIVLTEKISVLTDKYSNLQLDFNQLLSKINEVENQEKQENIGKNEILEYAKEMIKTNEGKAFLKDFLAGLVKWLTEQTIKKLFLFT